MKTIAIKLALVSLLVLVPLAYAARKEVKFTTYYPAPVGDYRNLSSTGDTNLATTSGGVGIGTTNPVTSGLQVVGGPVNATGGLIIHVVPAGSAAPTNNTAIDGQIWLDQNVAVP